SGVPGRKQGRFRHRGSLGKILTRASEVARNWEVAGDWWLGFTGQRKDFMILVTGATGPIGRELVPRLLEAGEQVRVFVRDQEKVGEKRVEIAVGDLRQP